MLRESSKEASAETFRELLSSGQVKVAVVGLGRIGLPTAAMFAKAGAVVRGVDINPRLVESINSGRNVFIDEPGLTEIVKEVVKNGKLQATLEPSSAISASDFVIVSVPTPVLETKSPDYSAVMTACRTIGKNMKRGCTVIIESTIGPGTAENLVLPILEKESGLRAGADFGLASCPERSDPGNILSNMRSLPRVVGGIDAKYTELVASLYEAVLGTKVIRVSNPRTANAVKLTENLFRDVNIALMNEFALLYEKLGIDTIEVINACSTKYNFMPHYPGPGVGGPCLPSNSYYLIEEGIKAGNIPYLIRMAREINDRMPEHVVELVFEAMNEVNKTIAGSTICVLGVSYKQNVKDIQLTPVERICKRLRSMGAKIKIYDPMYAGEEVFGFKVEKTLEEAVSASDCIIIGTAHNEFKGLDIKKLSSLMNEKPAMVDTRDIISPFLAKSSGFAYRGVGRPSVINEPNSK
ncbi:MAG: nucleotide sugar dehydrogenase [Conexivisphaerales archaeon]